MTNPRLAPVEGDHWISAIQLSLTFSCQLIPVLFDGLQENLSDKTLRSETSQTDTPALAFLKSREAKSFINARDEKALREAMNVLSPEYRVVAEKPYRLLPRNVSYTGS
ncbi:MAG: hypothetical protein HY731_10105 [Candidatus Tectomicrobia bacterium]|nr:hypothetical protein [Candidatus Tectomicrobia bacterium]